MGAADADEASAMSEPRSGLAVPRQLASPQSGVVVLIRVLVDAISLANQHGADLARRLSLGGHGL